MKISNKEKVGPTDLLPVADFIKGLPNRKNFNFKHGFNQRFFQSECGTPSCFAGWVGHFYPKILKKVSGDFVKLLPEFGISIVDTAKIIWVVNYDSMQPTAFKVSKRVREIVSKYKETHTFNHDY